jgi:hypothetical protein
MCHRAVQIEYEKAWGPDHISTLDQQFGNLYTDQGKLVPGEDVPAAGTAKIREGMRCGETNDARALL